MLNLKGVDTVCKYGVSEEFFNKLRPWLRADQERRLFFIDETEKTIDHPQVKVFHGERSQVAERIAGLSAMKELLIVDPEWAFIEGYRQLAFARISDVSDFGAMAMRHFKSNFQKKMRSLAALKNSMKGIPAVVCGAGPSLEKTGHLLKEWKDKALLIATGTAINVMETKPDLAVALDPHNPLIRKRHFDVPLCLQGRLHPDSFPPNIEAFYFPDSHHAYDPWLTGSEGLFDAGFTVGTAGAAIASFLGCSPIILIGMDYCYRGEQKYAGGGTCEVQIQALDAKGKLVWTQKDWLLAIRWLEEFAVGKNCWNVSQGMAIRGFEPVGELTGSGVQEKWMKAMALAPEIGLHPERYAAWKEGKMVNELYLEPLWHLWSPIFERELMVDPVPLPMEEKLAIQKKLFFEEVMSVAL